MDKYNLAILNLLRQNARQSWREIGSQVFLSGQAVGIRVQQMQEQGIIKGYTVREGCEHLHFITVYMRTNAFAEFEAAVAALASVQEAYKVSGEACYQLVVRCASAAELEDILNHIAPFGTYKVASALSAVK